MTEESHPKAEVLDQPEQIAALIEEVEAFKLKEVAEAAKGLE